MSICPKVERASVTAIVPRAGGVRYQYPGEDWKFVSGGARFEKASSGQIGVRYRVEGTYNRAPYFACGVSQSWYIENVYPPIFGWRVELPDKGLYRNPTRFYASDRSGTQERNYGIIVSGSGQLSYINGRPDCSDANADNFGLTYLFGSLKITRTIRMDGQSDPCTFKVFDSFNQIIYTETRAVCPTAEVIPCQYNDSDEQTFEVLGDGKMDLTVLELPVTDSVRTTQIKLGDTVVKSLSSPSGCNLYPKVVLDCEAAKKCPPDTCEVDCRGHVCCFNEQGIAVYQFVR